MSDESPILRVVRGEPTPEELAVVTAACQRCRGEADDATPPLRGRWNDPASVTGARCNPGPVPGAPSGSLARTPFDVGAPHRAAGSDG